MRVAPLAGHMIRTATGPGYRRFHRSLDRPREAQEAVLARIVRDAAAGAYGRHHGLAPGDGLVAFRERVPVATYEDLRPWVERAVFGGERGMLGPHPVVRVEATSGSSAAVKWVPYPRAMLGSFARMFSLWAHDLLRHRLYRPRTGRLFLCVTGGHPDDGTLAADLIGDDRDYLGTTWRMVLGRFVVAPHFAHAEDPVAMLAETLAGDSEIEVMSFWSPSLLLSVLDHLGVHTADEARRAWPGLQLISCWTAASSALFVPRLRELFPHAVLQGKGLLATEAAVTIPLEEAGGCVPLVDDVFLEFLDPEGRIHRLHEVREGGEYEVLVSTRGGFLRYRLGDRVRVAGRLRATPLLEFRGRSGIVSDRVGEKLALGFVEEVLAPAVGDYFCLLPVERRYVLWLDAAEHPEPIAPPFEACLERNFQYARAIRFGQLDPLEVRSCGRLADRIREAVEAAKGRSRAFKPPLLIADPSLAAAVNDALRRTAPASTA